MSHNKYLENFRINVEKYKPDSHDDIIKKFDCGNESINNCLCDAKDFSATTILFFNHDSNDLIGYCSYCCSSIRIQEEIKEYEEPKIITECYPAMEIKLFGISKKYQKCKFSLNGKEQSVSIFIFKYILNYLKHISDNYIFSSYIILYSLPDVTGFYEKSQFEFISKDKEVLKGYFSQDCVPMYLPI